MVEGHPDMRGWGVQDIFKEAGRLLYKYIWLFHPFIVAFLLPVAVILFLEAIGYSWIAPHEPPRHFGGIFDPHHHHHHHHFGFDTNVFSKVQATNGYQSLPPSILRVVLIANALAIVIWLLVSLAIAAIAKAVQYIYSDNAEDPAIVKSIFKSLPEAFFRIFITSLWILLIDLVAYVVVSLPFYLLSAAKINPKLLESVYQAFLLVALFLVDFLFLLSQQVAVLEPENYGLAALKGSVKLVQAKFPTALTLFVIYVVYGFSFGQLFQITVLFPGNGEVPYWIVYVLAVLLALVYLAFSSFWLVVTTVFYFSSELKDGAEEQLLPEENLYQPIAVSAED